MAILDNQSDIHSRYTLFERIGQLKRLRRFARYMTGDLRSGDELIQECLNAAGEGFAGLDAASFRIRLFKDFMNQYYAVNRYQRPPARTHEKEQKSDKLEDLRHSSGSSMPLQAGIMRMEASHRAALLLVVTEGFSYDQAAEILGIPTPDLRKWLSNARLELNNWLRGAKSAAEAFRVHADSDA